ncbi:TetR/AcrR family transcriptional regulator [Methanobrevibacter sp.]|uniref:TetR/AcrR family transcriptional regulator n=1 Tax=Methanobrevibacter sp. TaxID=66852 RepID=UPI00261B388F|nr:TetR/AcrR family transcriptional regulator [uncultured Methanobrevibacter sp.]
MKKMSTKEKIFNVSIDLFSKKGYNQVSTREIAREVGIKESSIYYHYSKKEDILDSIFDYFIERMNQAESSEEDMDKLLEISPNELYHFGSEAIKYQFSSFKMIKILRLIFIEVYHNAKIRKFFIEELLNGPIEFWTVFFQNFMDRKIIKKGNPRKLAENYFGYGIFKMFELVVLNFPKDNEDIDLNLIFDDIENHFNFIIDAVSISDENIGKNKKNYIRGCMDV